mgnify:CR=1 FL=1
MKTNILKRISALAMTAVMAFSISGGVSAAEETAEAAAEAPTQPDCGADGAPQAQEAGA